MSVARLNTQDEKDRKIESLEAELTALRQLVRDQASGAPARKWFAGITSLDVIGTAGVSFVSVGVGFFDWKVGMIVAGVLLIATCLYAARAD